jgi:hypothetical protein
MSRQFMFLLTLVVLLAASCDDDDPSGPSAPGLVGTWNLTAIELVSVANPGVHVDLMDEGVTGSLILGGDGDFVLSVNDPIEGPESFTGTWTMTDVLTLEHDPGQFVGEWQFGVTLTESTLRMTGADAEFDFDDDGVEDPAKLNLTGTRS